MATLVNIAQTSKEKRHATLSGDGIGVLRVRILWRGSLVSERSIKVAVGTIRGTERERCLVEPIRIPIGAGPTDIAIAEQFERKGSKTGRAGRFMAKVVSKHRSQPKSDRAWSGSGAASAPRGIRSSRWPSKSALIVSGSTAGSPRFE